MVARQAVRGDGDPRGPADLRRTEGPEDPGVAHPLGRSTL